MSEHEHDQPHNPGEPTFGEGHGGEHNPGEPEFGEQELDRDDEHGMADEVADRAEGHS